MDTCYVIYLAVCVFGKMTAFKPRRNHGLFWGTTHDEADLEYNAK